MLPKFPKFHTSGGSKPPARALHLGRAGPPGGLQLRGGGARGGWELVARGGGGGGASGERGESGIVGGACLGGGGAGGSAFCPRLAGVGPPCKDAGGGARPSSQWEARFRTWSRLQAGAAVWDWAARLHLRPPSGVTRPPPPPALPSLPPGRPAAEETLGRQRCE